MAEISFCKNNEITSMTDSDINSIFGTTTAPGLLPASPYSSANRELNGKLTQKTLDEIVSQFKKNNTSAPTKDAIKNEYCFYDTRYKYALKKLIDSIQNNENNKNEQIIKNYLNQVQKLNQRLNDLTQIVEAITISLEKSMKDMNKELYELAQEIKKRESKLNNQNNILSSSDASENLAKRMVKYTEEKGRYNNNLLTLYSFLNVVALGLLVYVYKSAN
jgi:hypothetical protein